MTDAEWKTLGSVLRESGGSIKTGPFGTTLKAAEYSRTGVPVISVGEVGRGRIRITDSTRRVGAKVVRRLPEYVLNAGDIVFGRKGAVDRSALIHDSEGGCFLGSDGIRVRFDAAVDARFIGYQLQSAQARDWLIQNAIGTTMPSLNQAVLERMPIRVPPISDQRVIAQALGEVDEFIASLEHLIAKKQEMRQGMLQRYMSGQVSTPGNAGIEREEQRLGYLLLRPPRYGINAAAVPLKPGITTYIRITDIDDSGRFSPNPKVGVSHPNAAHYSLRPGELLLARTGASVGKSYLCDPRDGELVYAGFLINIAPDPQRLNPRFLALYTQTKDYWDWVARTSVRSGQPGINGQEYAQLPLSLPDIETQDVIARIFSDVDHDIETLEWRLAKIQDIKIGMMQQLLTGRTRLPVQESIS